MAHKRKDIDWKTIQSDYNKGMTWRELRLKYGLCSATIGWGRKNGYLTFRNASESQKLAWKTGKQNPEVYRTKEHRKIMSKFGGYKENSGRCKHIPYTRKDGVVADLQGTWELKLVQFFDQKNIQWVRNKIGYKYLFEEKERTYFPDFFLSQLNVYVEVKGYQTLKDEAKWKQFPFKLSVVKRKEIEDLESWWKTI